MKNNPMLQKYLSEKGRTTQTLNTKHPHDAFRNAYLCKPLTAQNSYTGNWEMLDGSARPVTPKKVHYSNSTEAWQKFLDALLLREFIGDHVRITLLNGMLFPTAMVKLADHYWLWNLPQLRHVWRIIKSDTDVTITAHLLLERVNAREGRYFKGIEDITGTSFKIGKLRGPSLPELEDGL